MRLLGTFINVAAVIAGSLVGLLFRAHPTKAYFIVWRA